MIDMEKKSFSEFKRVIIESPYKGRDQAELERNIAYARACLRDSLQRGEAPFASHLLYTQDGVLDDAILEERNFGIAAGLAWQAAASLVAVYDDLGISEGMRKGIKLAKCKGILVEYRRLAGYKP